MALELGGDDGTVGFTGGLGQAPRQVASRARDLPGLLAQVARAKRRFGLPAEAPGHRVYEAGRDGCWWHRCLLTHGEQNVVVDAASSDVNRRYRRVKTDKRAGQKRLTLLGRCVLGETRLWPVVPVPSPEAEGLRQPHRAVIARQEARPQHVKRMTGLRAGLGREAVISATCPGRWQALRRWAGAPGPAALQPGLRREFARWAPVPRPGWCVMTGRGTRGVCAGWGPSRPGSECARSSGGAPFGPAGHSRPWQGCPPHRLTPDSRSASRASVKRTANGCAGSWSNSPGVGSPGHPPATAVEGPQSAAARAVRDGGSWGSLPGPGSAWGPCGGWSHRARSRRAPSAPIGPGQGRGAAPHAGRGA
jgi:hypothetical protein